MNKPLLFLCLLPLTIPAADMTATNSFDLQAVASTTAIGITNQVAPTTFPKRRYIVHHKGIPNQTAATNGLHSLRVLHEFSLDNTNWTTMAEYRPLRTNQVVDVFEPSWNNVTSYFRVRIITTNTVTVGVTAVAGTP